MDNSDCVNLSLSDLLRNAPKNWSRWGTEDEVGGLNFLDEREVLRGIQAVRQGRVFTLGARIADPEGDPIWPGRVPSQRYNTQDYSTYSSGKIASFGGGAQYADDVVMMFLQGSTHVDALGHSWYDETLYNGYSAETTTDGLSRASVLPLAERGIVGRGVLVDMARYRGKDHLERGEAFSLEELLDAAERQHSSIEKHDCLLVRTGWLKLFYDGNRSEFYREPFLEPGLRFSREVVDWFYERELPVFATDTIANEVTAESDPGFTPALHASLMRNLGVTFHEILVLEDLADHCAADGQYTFLYVAAPLKVAGGTGAPVNPLAVK